MLIKLQLLTKDNNHKVDASTWINAGYIIRIDHYPDANKPIGSRVILDASSVTADQHSILFVEESRDDIAKKVAMAINPAL